MTVSHKTIILCHILLFFMTISLIIGHGKCIYNDGFVGNNGNIRHYNTMTIFYIIGIFDVIKIKTLQ